MSRYRDYHDYDSDDEQQYSSPHTRPLSRYSELARGTGKEYPKTTVRPKRVCEIDYRDKPVRRQYDGCDDRSRHDEARHRPSRRRCHSLHTKNDVEYRRRGDRHRSKATARTQGEHRLVEAATAGLAAGVTEAVRARHDPDRSRRAVTAAVSAAAVDALASNGDERKRGRHLVESAVSGLLIDRLANRRSGK
ncbi:hypothetical protein V8C26DRAFT_414782 [Trichoderma gracile]